MWEAWVRSLGWEDPLEEGMATHSSILTWSIPMDRGAWRATVHGVAKSQTRQQLSTQHSALYYWDRSGTLKWTEQPHICMCRYTHLSIYIFLDLYLFLYLYKYRKSWVHINICSFNSMLQGLPCILPFYINNNHLQKKDILFPLSSIHPLTCSFPAVCSQCPDPPGPPPPFICLVDPYNLASNWI